MNTKKKFLTSIMAIVAVTVLFVANISEAYVISDEAEHHYGDYIESWR